MRDKTKNGANLNRNSSLDGSIKSDIHCKEISRKNTTKNQVGNPTENVTDEAIDVLTFMGFKL